MGVVRLAAIVSGALALAVVAGCDDSKKFGQGGDYSLCPEGTIVDYSDNQKVVCNDLVKGVEQLCGFDLTVDVCACAVELTDCTADGPWLRQILDCRGSSGDCVEYMVCLEAVGVSPSGCTDPTTWPFLESTTDTDGE